MLKTTWKVWLQDIKPYVLQLKKKAAISCISPDFNNWWNNVLKEAERKLLKLSLKEVTEISKLIESLMKQLNLCTD